MNNSDAKTVLMMERGDQCWYCGRPVAPSMCYVVPINPRSYFMFSSYKGFHRFNYDDIQNKSLACTRCKTLKRDQTLEQYRTFIIETLDALYSISHDYAVLFDMGLVAPTGTRKPIFHFEKNDTPQYLEKTV